MLMWYACFLSQFFKQPLLSPQCVHREIEAVDAEDCKNRQLDARRALQVLKSLFTQTEQEVEGGHGQKQGQGNVEVGGQEGQRAEQYAKYSTGNARTLRDHPHPSAATTTTTATVTTATTADVDDGASTFPERDIHAASNHTAVAMRRFYAEHYSKARMAVTLVGPQR
jgi:secreted Zn-dependent insulinase-like peptidase